MASVTGIRGRFFAPVLNQALQLYLRHKTTIDPVLSAAAKAALAALIAELPAIISALNPKGPG